MIWKTVARIVSTIVLILGALGAIFTIFKIQPIEMPVGFRTATIWLFILSGIAGVLAVYFSWRRPPREKRLQQRLQQWRIRPLLRSTKELEQASGDLFEMRYTWFDRKLYGYRRINCLGLLTLSKYEELVNKIIVEISDKILALDAGKLIVPSNNSNTRFASLLTDKTGLPWVSVAEADLEKIAKEEIQKTDKLVVMEALLIDDARIAEIGNCFPDQIVGIVVLLDAGLKKCHPRSYGLTKEQVVCAARVNLQLHKKRCMDEWDDVLYKDR